MRYSYLRGGPPHGLAPAVVFETGSNRWRSFDAWPPRAQLSARRLYLAAGGRVDWTDPSAQASASSAPSGEKAMLLRGVHDRL